MARLPEALPDPIAGSRVPAIGVGATDLGLTQLAAGVAAYGEEETKADKVIAGRRLLELQKENETDYETGAASYTSEDPPGFAEAQINRAQERANKLLRDPSLRRGERAQLNELANNEIARVGRLAIAHEANTRAKPLAELAAAREAADVNDFTTQAITKAGPRIQALINGYDGDPGHKDRVAAVWDEEQAAAVAAAPDRLKGQVLATLDKEGVRVKAEAATTEQNGLDRHVLKKAQEHIDLLSNGILSNPAAYAPAVAALPDIVATVQPGLRPGVQHEVMGTFADNRITALINNGEVDQADLELNVEGRYDADLKPEAKKQLQARLKSAQEYHAPRTVDEATAYRGVLGEMEADVTARQTTGQSTGRVNLEEAAKIVGPMAVAAYKESAAQADLNFAATGPLPKMPTAELRAALNAPRPDPSEPNYGPRLTAWQNMQVAGRAELTAREDGATHVFTIQPKPKAGTGAADTGAILQGHMQTWMEATPGAAQNAAGVRLATQSLGAQYMLGIDPAARGILPKATIEALGASITNAPEEQQAQALMRVSALIGSLPRTVLMPDGTVAAPQAMMIADLKQKGHLSAVWSTALQDFGGNATLMGRFVTAMNEAKGAEALPKEQNTAIRQAAVTELQPLLTTLAPLPGALEDSKARVDRTVLMAGWHVRHEHLSPAAAAKAAAGELTAGYRFADNWRMPAAAAGAKVQVRSGPLGVPWDRDGLAASRQGAARMLADLLKNNGEYLYAAMGEDADQRKAWANKVEHSAQWVTASDDSGLVLMVPQPDHTWTPVADKWGTAVRASWAQLGAHASVDHPSPFLKPPAAVLRDTAGKPMAAVSKQRGFDALVRSITWTESRGKLGQVSPAGALGPMQVMPITVDTYAPRLNLPVDYKRAQHDVAYNRAIGQAALLDMVNRYGSGPGLVVAIAAYNAGPGTIEGRTEKGKYIPGWLQTLGDPRKGRITSDQWVASIPYKETRDYVRAVLGLAVADIQRGGRGR